MEKIQMLFPGGKPVILSEVVANAISNDKTLEHVIFAGFTHPKAVEMTELLLSILPDNQTFLSDNGSTSVEVD